jgi:hypothetical protein
MADHIDEFDKTVGLIFGALYRSFPIRISVDSDVMENKIEGVGPDWLERYASQNAIFGATMAWLIDAGYIWGTAHPDHMNYFTECVLSTKGLEILTMPSSISGASGSIGASLGKAAGSVVSDTVKDLAKEALTFGAQMLVAYGRSKLT